MDRELESHMKPVPPLGNGGGRPHGRKLDSFFAYGGDGDTKKSEVATTRGVRSSGIMNFTTISAAPPPPQSQQLSLSNSLPGFSVEAKRDYIRRHGLTSLFDRLASQILEAQPENPALFLREQLVRLHEGAQHRVQDGTGTASPASDQDRARGVGLSSSSSSLLPGLHAVEGAAARRARLPKSETQQFIDEVREETLKEIDNLKADLALASERSHAALPGVEIETPPLDRVESHTSISTLESAGTVSRQGNIPIPDTGHLSTGGSMSSLQHDESGLRTPFDRARTEPYKDSSSSMFEMSNCRSSDDTAPDEATAGAAVRGSLGGPNVTDDHTSPLAVADLGGRIIVPMQKRAPSGNAEAQPGEHADVPASSAAGAATDSTQRVPHPPPPHPVAPISVQKAAHAGGGSGGHQTPLMAMSPVSSAHSGRAERPQMHRSLGGSSTLTGVDAEDLISEADLPYPTRSVLRSFESLSQSVVTSGNFGDKTGASSGSAALSPEDRSIRNFGDERRPSRRSQQQQRQQSGGPVAELGDNENSSQLQSSHNNVVSLLTVNPGLDSAPQSPHNNDPSNRDCSWGTELVVVVGGAVRGSAGSSSAGTSTASVDSRDPAADLSAFLSFVRSTWPSPASLLGSVVEELAKWLFAAHVSSVSPSWIASGAETEELPLASSGNTNSSLLPIAISFHYACVMSGIAFVSGVQLAVECVAMAFEAVFSTKIIEEWRSALRFRLLGAMGDLEKMSVAHLLAMNQGPLSWPHHVQEVAKKKLLSLNAIPADVHDTYLQDLVAFAGIFESFIKERGGGKITTPTLQATSLDKARAPALGLWILASASFASSCYSVPSVTINLFTAKMLIAFFVASDPVPPRSVLVVPPVQVLQEVALLCRSRRTCLRDVVAAAIEKALRALFPSQPESMEVDEQLVMEVYHLLFDRFRAGTPSNSGDRSPSSVSSGGESKSGDSGENGIPIPEDDDGEALLETDNDDGEDSLLIDDESCASDSHCGGQFLSTSSRGADATVEDAFASPRAENQHARSASAAAEGCCVRDRTCTCMPCAFKILTLLSEGGDIAQLCQRALRAHAHRVSHAGGVPKISEAVDNNEKHASAASSGAATNRSGVDVSFAQAATFLRDVCRRILFHFSTHNAEQTSSQRRLREKQFHALLWLFGARLSVAFGSNDSDTTAGGSFVPIMEDQRSGQRGGSSGNSIISSDFRTWLWFTWCTIRESPSARAALSQDIVHGILCDTIFPHPAMSKPSSIRRVARHIVQVLDDAFTALLRDEGERGEQDMQVILVQGFFRSLVTAWLVSTRTLWDMFAVCIANAAVRQAKTTIFSSGAALPQQQQHHYDWLADVNRRTRDAWLSFAVSMSAGLTGTFSWPLTEKGQHQQRVHADCRAFLSLSGEAMRKMALDKIQSSSRALQHTSPLIASVQIHVASRTALSERALIQLSFGGSAEHANSFHPGFYEHLLVSGMPWPGGADTPRSRRHGAAPANAPSSSVYRLTLEIVHRALGNEAVRSACGGLDGDAQSQPCLETAGVTVGLLMQLLALSCGSATIAAIESIAGEPFSVVAEPIFSVVPQLYAQCCTRHKTLPFVFMWVALRSQEAALRLLIRQFSLLWVALAIASDSSSKRTELMLGPLRERAWCLLRGMTTAYHGIDAACAASGLHSPDSFDPTRWGVAQHPQARAVVTAILAAGARHHETLMKNSRPVRRGSNVRRADDDALHGGDRAVGTGFSGGFAQKGYVVVAALVAWQQQHPASLVQLLLDLQMLCSPDLVKNAEDFVARSLLYDVEQWPASGICDADILPSVCAMLDAVREQPLRTLALVQISDALLESSRETLLPTLNSSELRFVEELRMTLEAEGVSIAAADLHLIRERMELASRGGGVAGHDSSGGGRKGHAAHTSCLSAAPTSSSARRNSSRGSAHALNIDDIALVAVRRVMDAAAGLHTLHLAGPLLTFARLFLAIIWLHPWEHAKVLSLMTYRLQHAGVDVNQLATPPCSRSAKPRAELAEGKCMRAPLRLLATALAHVVVGSRRGSDASARDIPYFFPAAQVSSQEDNSLAASTTSVQRSVSSPASSTIASAAHKGSPLLSVFTHFADCCIRVAASNPSVRDVLAVQVQVLWPLSISRAQHRLTQSAAAHAAGGSADEHCAEEAGDHQRGVDTTPISSLSQAILSTISNKFPALLVTIEGCEQLEQLISRVFSNPRLLLVPCSPEEASTSVPFATSHSQSDAHFGSPTSPSTLALWAAAVSDIAVVLYEMGCAAHEVFAVLQSCINIMINHADDTNCAEALAEAERAGKRNAGGRRATRDATAADGAEHCTAAGGADAHLERADEAGCFTAITGGAMCGLLAVAGFDGAPRSWTTRFDAVLRNRVASRFAVVVTDHLDKIRRRHFPVRAVGPGLDAFSRSHLSTGTEGDNVAEKIRNDSLGDEKHSGNNSATTGSAQLRPLLSSWIMASAMRELDWRAVHMMMAATGAPLSVAAIPRIATVFGELAAGDAPDVVFVLGELCQLGITITTLRHLRAAVLISLAVRLPELCRKLDTKGLAPGVLLTEGHIREHATAWWATFEGVVNDLVASSVSQHIKESTHSSRGLEENVIQGNSDGGGACTTHTTAPACPSPRDVALMSVDALASSGTSPHHTQPGAFSPKPRPRVAEQASIHRLQELMRHARAPKHVDPARALKVFRVAWDSSCAQHSSTTAAPLHRSGAETASVIHELVSWFLDAHVSARSAVALASMSAMAFDGGDFSFAASSVSQAISRRRSVAAGLLHGSTSRSGSAFAAAPGGSEAAATAPQPLGVPEVGETTPVPDDAELKRQRVVLENALRNEHSAVSSVALAVAQVRFRSKQAFRALRGHWASISRKEVLMQTVLTSVYNASSGQVCSIFSASALSEVCLPTVEAGLARVTTSFSELLTSEASAASGCELAAALVRMGICPENIKLFCSSLGLELSKYPGVDSQLRNFIAIALCIIGEQLCHLFHEIEPRDHTNLLRLWQLIPHQELDGCMRAAIDSAADAVRCLSKEVPDQMLPQRSGAASSKSISAGLHHQSSSALGASAVSRHDSAVGSLRVVASDATNETMPRFAVYPGLTSTIERLILLTAGPLLSHGNENSPDESTSSNESMRTIQQVAVRHLFGRVGVPQHLMVLHYIIERVLPSFHFEDSSHDSATTPTASGIRHQGLPVPARTPPLSRTRDDLLVAMSNRGESHFASASDSGLRQFSWASASTPSRTQSLGVSAQTRVLPEVGGAVIAAAQLIAGMNQAVELTQEDYRCLVDDVNRSRLLTPHASGREQVGAVVAMLEKRYCATLVEKYDVFPGWVMAVAVPEVAAMVIAAFRISDYVEVSQLVRATRIAVDALQSFGIDGVLADDCLSCMSKLLAHAVTSHSHRRLSRFSEVIRATVDVCYSINPPLAHISELQLWLQRKAQRLLPSLLSSVAARGLGLPLLLAELLRARQLEASHSHIPFGSLPATTSEMMTVMASTVFEGMTKLCQNYDESDAVVLVYKEVALLHEMLIRAPEEERARLLTIASLVGQCIADELRARGLPRLLRTWGFIFRSTMVSLQYRLADTLTLVPPYSRQAARRMSTLDEVCLKRFSVQKLHDETRQLASSHDGPVSGKTTTNLTTVADESAAHRSSASNSSHLWKRASVVKIEGGSALSSSSSSVQRQATNNSLDVSSVNSNLPPVVSISPATVLGLPEAERRATVIADISCALFYVLQEFATHASTVPPIHTRASHAAAQRGGGEAESASLESVKKRVADASEEITQLVRANGMHPLVLQTAAADLIRVLANDVMRNGPPLSRDQWHMLSAVVFSAVRAVNSVHAEQERAVLDHAIAAHPKAELRRRVTDVAENASTVVAGGMRKIFPDPLAGFLKAAAAEALLAELANSVVPLMQALALHRTDFMSRFWSSHAARRELLGVVDLFVAGGFTTQELYDLVHLCRDYFDAETAKSMPPPVKATGASINGQSITRRRSMRYFTKRALQQEHNQAAMRVMMFAADCTLGILVDLLGAAPVPLAAHESAVAGNAGKRSRRHRTRSVDSNASIDHGAQTAPPSTRGNSTENLVAGASNQPVGVLTLTDGPSPTLFLANLLRITPQARQVIGGDTFLPRLMRTMESLTDRTLVDHWLSISSFVVRSYIQTVRVSAGANTGATKVIPGSASPPSNGGLQSHTGGGNTLGTMFSPTAAQLYFRLLQSRVGGLREAVCVTEQVVDDAVTYWSARDSTAAFSHGRWSKLSEILTLILLEHKQVLLSTSVPLSLLRMMRFLTAEQLTVLAESLVGRWGHVVFELTAELSQPPQSPCSDRGANAAAAGDDVEGPPHTDEPPGQFAFIDTLRALRVLVSLLLELRCDARKTALSGALNSRDLREFVLQHSAEVEAGLQTAPLPTTDLVDAAVTLYRHIAQHVQASELPSSLADLHAWFETTALYLAAGDDEAAVAAVLDAVANEVGRVSCGGEATLGSGSGISYDMAIVTLLCLMHVRAERSNTEAKRFVIPPGYSATFSPQALIVLPISSTLRQWWGVESDVEQQRRADWARVVPASCSTAGDEKMCRLVFEWSFRALHRMFLFHNSNLVNSVNKIVNPFVERLMAAEATPQLVKKVLFGMLSAAAGEPECPRDELVALLAVLGKAVTTRLKVRLAMGASGEQQCTAELLQELTSPTGSVPPLLSLAAPVDTSILREDASTRRRRLNDLRLLSFLWLSSLPQISKILRHFKTLFAFSYRERGLEASAEDKVQLMELLVVIHEVSLLCHPSLTKAPPLVLSAQVDAQLTQYFNSRGGAVRSDKFSETLFNTFALTLVQTFVRVVPKLVTPTSSEAALRALRHVELEVCDVASPVFSSSLTETSNHSTSSPVTTLTVSTAASLDN